MLTTLFIPFSNSRTQYTQILASRFSFSVISLPSFFLGHLYIDTLTYPFLQVKFHYYCSFYLSIYLSLSLEISFYLSSMTVSSMAFKKSLAQRLFNLTKISSQTLTNCRISSSSVHARVSSGASGERNIAPDPGDNGVFRRFLHKRPGFQPELRSPPVGGNIIERLRAMDIARNRIRLDGLRPPAAEEEEERDVVEDVTAEDAKKLLRAAQVEVVKSKLREIRKTCIPLTEFVRICSENCSDQDQAVRIAKMLDDSAAVIILGDVVFLRPEQEIETLLFRKI